MDTAVAHTAGTHQSKAIMVVGCKRLLAPYADLLGPLQKRGRMDAHMAGPEDDLAQAQEAFASSGSYAAGLDAIRRRQHLDDLQEFCAEQPSDKRPRIQGDFLAALAAAVGDGSGGAASASEGDSAGSAGSCSTQRGWSEELVRTLHGCPSVEEAIRRCGRVLADFEAEVRQTRREADAGEAGQESVKDLQHTKKVLMRAVNHLAQRCRQNEACVAEVDTLKEELERSKEAQRRLQHHNEMLQLHLKVHLDSCAR